eukprot:TRINITY_DN2443_c0_g1_i1.p1 TRINITY_DN2443_c0_g1~~TRINITY_DN2443_c0_g1_i1.p1  ORF type:complete len:94 (+),score=6.06 TRINITY_DN2443_c0_g1_i1:263-544(+)
MAGVCSTVETTHNIRFFSENIYKFSFPSSPHCDPRTQSTLPVERLREFPKFLERMTARRENCDSFFMKLCDCFSKIYNMSCTFGLIPLLCVHG